jgi:uncharacterized membrane protein YciS (DUF1049 family)
VLVVLVLVVVAVVLVVAVALVTNQSQQQIVGSISWAGCKVRLVCTVGSRLSLGWVSDIY